MRWSAHVRHGLELTSVCLVDRLSSLPLCDWMPMLTSIGRFRAASTNQTVCFCVAIQLAAETAMNSDLLPLPAHLSSPLKAESRAKDRAIARERIALAEPRLLNSFRLAPDSTE